MKVYPSLLAADPLRLADSIKLVENCDGFHVDIMDDHFVANLSGSVDLVSAVQKATEKPVFIHLMVEKPEKWLDRLSLREGDCFVFHWEAAAGELARNIIDKAREKNWCVGVAVRPKTPVEELRSLMEFLHVVMVMSVEPGYSGQSFLEGSLSKLEELKKLCDESNSGAIIMADGGVTLDIMPELARVGVDSVAVGTAVFGSDDPASVIQKMQGG